MLKIVVINIRLVTGKWVIKASKKYFNNFPWVIPNPIMTPVAPCIRIMPIDPVNTNIRLVRLFD